MNMETHDRHEFKELRCCVLLPTYNNAGTLAAVITDVSGYTHEICVVNDGSTDHTLSVLESFPHIKLLSYPNNVGKGWALRKGFEFARANGYDYAITIDTDGQHFADDLPVMIEALKQHKNAIVVGARNMAQNGIPGKSNFGNKFSNFWFQVETGIKLPDTQSGYRLYPLMALEPLTFFSRKYEFEIEVLIRSAWSGIDVLHVPVRVYYPPADERVSHFRPFQDFSRISVVYTVLVIVTFLWIKPRDLFNSIRKKSLRHFFDEYLVRSHETPAVKAFSVALGMFFGISPLWGFQIWFVLFFAWLFKLNKVLAALVSNVSIPPMIPVILFLSYETGRIWMGPNAVHLSYSRNMTMEVIQKNVLQYVLGSFTLAAICSVIAGIGTYIFVSNLKKQGKQG